MSELNGNNGKKRKGGPGRPKGSKESEAVRKSRTKKLAETKRLKREKEGLPQWCLIFLAAVAGGMWEKDAAKRAGVHPKTVWDWKGKDEEFAELLRQAKQDKKDFARQEIYRRAFIGMKRRKYEFNKKTGKRELVQIEVEYSDKLAVLYAQANLPEYRRRQELDIAGRDGAAPIPIATVIVTTNQQAMEYREFKRLTAASVN